MDPQLRHLLQEYKRTCASMSRFEFEHDCSDIKVLMSTEHDKLRGQMLEAQRNLRLYLETSKEF